jgi:multimeric flavodoxin WrbA
MKVGAAVCTARRAGTDTNFDVINKYFTISNMVVVGSQYWNNAFGRAPGEAKQDEEGMQTMRHLGKNIAFVVKSINDGKQKYKINFNEDRKWTHFIR